MTKFEFTTIVDIDRDLIFEISTKYENFTKILPNYFKKLEILEKNEKNTKIYETINFLGRTTTVLTEHVVIKPDRHIVTMLDGQAKGSSFDEMYEKIGSQTKITVKVNFILHGSLKLLGFFAKEKIKTQMSIVMNEFVDYAKNNSN
jgi:ribosome-associated toxin RatA of RatAB toxin-antitoxin module|tara:strand:- start:192 stop:629 length:438 start_codon:yes stop_codon:yes gene_type:complete